TLRSSSTRSRRWPPSSRRPSTSSRPSRAAAWIPAALLIPLVLMPMAFLVVGSFQSAPPGQAGSWTFENYDVLWTGDILELVLGSLGLASAVTAISLTVGAALALALTRWEVPAARFLDSV